MFVFHSQLVVSGCPVPMYLDCSRSSSCWVRSLSACVACQSKATIFAAGENAGTRTMVKNVWCAVGNGYRRLMLQELKCGCREG